MQQTAMAAGVYYGASLEIAAEADLDLCRYTSSNVEARDLTAIQSYLTSSVLPKV